MGLRRCDSCDGTGQTEKWNAASHVYHDHECFICHGAGQVEDEPKTESKQMTEMSEVMSTCDDCNGTGEMDREDAWAQGIKPEDDMYPACPSCDGTGMKKGMGSGDIDEMNEVMPETLEDDVEQCPHCGEEFSFYSPAGSDCPSCGAELSPPSEEGCAECGAPLGTPCADGCPSASADRHEADPDRYREGVDAMDFDKFMDATLLKETRQATHDVKEVSPQRRLARNYQEHPLGKIRFNGGLRGR
jgi:hypothetical protein